MWLFAMRFWSIAQMIKGIMLNNSSTQQIQKTNRIVKAGICFIVVMAFYGASISFQSSLHPVLYSITQPTLWIFTFTFMLDGLRKIRVMMM